MDGDGRFVEVVTCAPLGLQSIAILAVIPANAGTQARNAWATPRIETKLFRHSSESWNPRLLFAAPTRPRAEGEDGFQLSLE